MRKNKTAIAAILLAVSMMTACAGSQTAQTAAGSSAAVEVTTAAADSSSAAEAAADAAGQTSAEENTGTSAENTGTAAGKTEAAPGTEIPASAVTVKMTGSGAEISGAGAEYADGALKITKGGTYMLSGELEGQVLLETDKKEEVTLYLNGVEITSEKAYAIASVKGKTVNVILPAGTENTLTVRGVADDDNAQTEEEEADAAIYVKNDLVVSGSGALKITSAGKGIHAKDTLTLADGTIDITSADDAFNGKDGITVDSGIFTVTITDTEEGKAMTSRGAVTLNDGTMTVAASSEGIEGLSVTVNGGTWDITAADDGVNAREKAETAETTETTETAAQETAVQETAAQETGAENMPQDGGSDSQGGQGGFGGGMPPQGAFDGQGGFGGGMPPQGAFDGQGGFGGGMPPQGGFNGHDGFGGMTEEEMQAERLKMQYNEKCQIVVNGGTLIVNSQGDGLDSNGDIHINGGEVFVNSMESDGNAALDWNGAGYVDGGSLIAAGMPGMAETLSDESSQNIITVYYEEEIEAGTEVTVKDSDGAVILSWTVPKSFRSLQLSSGDLETDKTYTITAGTVENSVTVSAINTYEGEHGFGGRGAEMGQGGPRGDFSGQEGMGQGGPRGDWNGGMDQDGSGESQNSEVK